MLTLENLSIHRGTRMVADDLNLSFKPGQVYTVLGPNGAGKSSLLKTIFGDVSYQGSIVYGNETLSSLNVMQWRKRIGFMPQDTTVEASLTALEVVLLGQVHSLSMHISDTLLTEAVEIMDSLGIADLAHQDVMRLSGGQRQLVMFAQVLLRHPEILLLDEPVSALDMRHQLKLLEHVCAYTHQRQLITIMVLHDLSLAAQFSDDLLLLGQGKVQAQGTPKKVLDADLISQLYQVNIELLYDSQGLPVIRPVRHHVKDAHQFAKTRYL